MCSFERDEVVKAIVTQYKSNGFKFQGAQGRCIVTYPSGRTYTYRDEADFVDKAKDSLNTDILTAQLNDRTLSLLTDGVTA